MPGKPVDEYGRAVPQGEPTPRQIARKAATIRRSWQDVKLRRRLGLPDPMVGRRAK